MHLAFQILRQEEAPKIQGALDKLRVRSLNLFG